MHQKNRAIWVYRWMEFIHWFAYGLVFPIFILYLHEERGFSLGEIGWLTAFFWILMITFQIPTGLIADRFGRKKAFMAAVAIGGISMCLHAYFAVFWLFFVSQTATAIARAFADGTLQSWVIEKAEIRDEVGRTRIANIGQQSFGYGVASSGVLSCLVAAHYRTYVISLIASGVILLLLAVIANFLIEEPRQSKSTEHPENRKKLLSILGSAYATVRENPLLKTTIIGGFFLSLTFSSVALYWPVYVMSSPATHVWKLDPNIVIGLLYASFTLFWIWGGSWAYRAISGGKKSAGVLYGAVALGIQGYALFVFGIDMMVAFSLGLALFNVAHGAFIPITRRYVHQCASDEVRTTILSMYFMAGALGTAIGLWTSAYAIEHFSFFWTWLGSLIVFTLSTLVLLPRLKKYDIVENEAIKKPALP